MIGAIKVLAIPAGWESDGGSDASAAHLVGEGEGVVTRAGGASERTLLNVLFAAMAELLLATLAGTKHWISDNHTEPWFESGGLGLSIIRRVVVDC